MSEFFVTPFSGISTDPAHNRTDDVTFTRLSARKGSVHLELETEAGERYEITAILDFDRDKQRGGVAVIRIQEQESVDVFGWMPTAPERYQLVIDGDCVNEDDGGSLITFMRTDTDGT